MIRFFCTFEGYKAHLFSQLLFSDLLLLQAGRILQHIDIYIILTKMDESNNRATDEKVLDRHLRMFNLNETKIESISIQYQFETQKMPHRTFKTELRTIWGYLDSSVIRMELRRRFKY